MRRTPDPISKSVHRKIAGELFNDTWTLLDQRRRTREEDLEMVHAAHASRYHWGRAGGPLQESIGEWQISRVYATLGRPEPAAYHGRQALRIARANDLAPFYVAYAYEALARAASLAGARRERTAYLRQAERAGRSVRSADDRRMLTEDLATIP